MKGPGIERAEGPGPLVNRRAQTERSRLHTPETGARVPEGDSDTRSTSPQRLLLRPVASAARLVRAALRGAGSTDFNGARPRCGNTGAAVRAVPEQRSHDPMSPIVTVQDVVTAFADWIEPTDAELDAIEREMPVILADVDLLDAQIVTLDRTPSELDARRIRRARRRVLTARRDLANRAADTHRGGAA
ncbi:hypothetical protein GCM10010121_026310 [Streptomyces brasiliensis]|uniref:Uncharacterized protein n=2 Tax=Streptomyces brasiliensis TaxID=1954 RepID=A0A917NNX9_9ACTN|nr:hypothetical protein GCM10010121_026310 [Streptomyces brasiliensis]